MRYLSLFSGIEAATVAWRPLGWECVGVAEIDPFASKVLRHHYPNVRNLGDVTQVTEMDVADLGAVDIVVFGSPCQDLSLAGKRKGLDGARSGLFFTAMQIIAWSRIWCGTRFALWENVPGAFSSNKGADFAAVVDRLSGLAGTEPPPKGWGNEGCAAGPEAMVEWATLDAQWFGVAQRRHRVFALADFGNWEGRQPILLEPQGLRGDTAPRREAGQVAPTVPARSHGGGGLGADFDCGGGLISKTLTTEQRFDYGTETFILQPLPFDTTQITSTANYSNSKAGDPCPPLTAGMHAPAVAIQGNMLNRSDTAGPRGSGVNAEGASFTLTKNDVHAVSFRMEVRRLTPLECERLQGFPENHTLLPGKAPDSPRYKALGNSMAVPVMRWIGRQIDTALLFQQ